MNFKKILIFFLNIPLFSKFVLGHQGHGMGGLIAGLTHPIFGSDHLLAMLSVGIISAQIGGYALWSVPLIFVLFMIVGGVMGLNFIPFIGVELGIAISVIILGIAIFSEKKLSIIITSLFIAFFGIFHGYAHGMEVPQIASPYLYVLGFILTTIIIHLSGLYFGYWFTKKNALNKTLRVCGLFIALIGILFLIKL